MSARLRLVTRADDLGMNGTVNRAIAATHDEGVVRNTSVMAPAPAVADAARMLATRPDLRAGMHVCVTSEWHAPTYCPVAGAATVPTLVADDGVFLPHGNHLYERKATVAELERELEAQYGLLRSLGIRLTYLDEHMGVGWQPGWGEAIKAFAAAHDLICDRTLHDEGRLQRLPRLDDPPVDPVDQFLAQLEQVDDGTFVVIGHPAFVTAEMESCVLRRVTDPPAARGEQAGQRDGERRRFMDAKVLAYVRAREIACIGYDEV